MRCAFAILPDMFGNLSINDLVIVFVSMVISVSIHEAMHAFAAHSLGDTTAEDEGRLTLNPLRHVDILTTVLLPVVLLALHLPPIFVARPVPFNPHNVRYGEFGAALVGLAGPFTNLLLAVIAAFLVRFFGYQGGFPDALIIFMQINVALFVFNMIPLPPLDGSRLLYALAPEPIQKAMYKLETAGIGVTLIIILVLSPFLLPLVNSITQAIITFLLR